MADDNLLTLTTEIVAAHVANNKVGTGDVAALISATYQALVDAGRREPEPEANETFTPATTVRKSLATPERIISMIDGKAYTSLTRHLRTQGLTPAEYRERYGLKADYPMVAPAYSEKRRAISLELGLGRKKAAPLAEPTKARTKASPAPEPQRNRPKLKLSGGDALNKVRTADQQLAEVLRDEPSSGRDSQLGDGQQGEA